MKFAIFVIAAFLAVFLILGIDSGAGPARFAAGALHQFSHAQPLRVVALWALGFALTSFLAGMVSGDYSWVDRLWSTLPVAFAWYYAWRGGFSLALLLAAALVSYWGIRLTWNFALKGGYTGTEDYRWAVLRQRIRNPIAWQAFNLFFISGFQVGIFVLFTAALERLLRMAAAGSPATRLNWTFYGLGLALMALALLWETVADAQQWEFQEAKAQHRQGQKVDKRFHPDVERGFRSTGLFAHSRHPAYFGELSTWWALWLAVCGLSASFLDWSIAGPLALTALFIGSTIFTEGITLSKYPEYAFYRKRVSAIIPWFARKDP